MVSVIGEREVFDFGSVCRVLGLLVFWGCGFG